jgi:hypothetical protein
MKFPVTATWKYFLPVIALALVAAAGLAEPPATRSVKDLSNGELIDRLTSVTNAEFSVRTNIIAMGADGKGAMPQGLLKMQEPGPKPGEAMEELVRRGPAALADLTAHLDDARPTKATIKGMMGGPWYSAEYDWNRRTGKVRPQGVVLNWETHKDVRIVRPQAATRRSEGGFASDDTGYAVVLGDICFNLIGRIVNRDFEAVKYRPSAIVIISSPVLCPDLRDSVRKEWGRLAPEEHRRSLIDDVSSPDRYGRAEGGVEILWRYYPNDVPKAVRARLALPEYDHREIEDFARAMYCDADAVDRRKRIEDFIASRPSSDRDGFLVQLWEDKFYKAGDKMFSPGPAPTVAVSAHDLLKEFVPEIDEDYPPLIDAVQFWETARFVESMAEIRSKDVDQAVFETFGKHGANHSERWGALDWVAEACLKHLARKQHDVELRQFCERRLHEVRDENDRRRIEALMALLTKQPMT